MAKRIVILGGGTGGTLMANRLRKTYDQARSTIAVVDRDDRHVYQPGPSLRSVRAREDRRRSCGRGSASCTRGSTSTRRRSTTSRSTTTACTSPTAPCSPTTC